LFAPAELHPEAMRGHCTPNAGFFKEILSVQLILAWSDANCVILSVFRGRNQFWDEIGIYW